MKRAYDVVAEDALTGASLPARRSWRVLLDYPAARTAYRALRGLLRDRRVAALVCVVRGHKRDLAAVDARTGDMIFVCRRCGIGVLALLEPEEKP